MQAVSVRSERRVFFGKFSSQPVCPDCGDHLVAPELSEFVEGGEIRHHWLCESCRRAFSTAVTPTCN